jgi:hypothetical protein
MIAREIPNINISNTMASVPGECPIIGNMFFCKPIEVYLAEGLWYRDKKWFIGSRVSV